MTLKDKLVTGSLVIGLVGIVALSSTNDNTLSANKSENKNKVKAESRIYEQFKERADANHDGHFIESELISVYDALGLKYDARKPDNLSEEQMKKYIDIRNKSGDYSY